MGLLKALVDVVTTVVTDPAITEVTRDARAVERARGVVAGSVADTRICQTLIDIWRLVRGGEEKENMGEK